MRRMSELTGMAVIADGRRAGRVAGVVLRDGRHISGVLIEGALGGSRMVAMEHIDVLGEVSVQCTGKGVRAGGSEPFSPRRAITTSGHRLGRVSDLLIDERTGQIEAIEISRGYIDDLLSGRLMCAEFALAPQTGDAVVLDAPSARSALPPADELEGGRI